MSTNLDGNNGENQELIKKFEELYKDIQKEIDFYRKEHEFLRSEIVRLAQESSRKRDGQCFGEEFNEIEYKKISDDVIKSLKSQLDLSNEVGNFR